MLGLECSEKSLLRSEDLDSGSWVLGQGHQTTGVCNQAGSNKLANKCCKIGCDGSHAVREVRVEFNAVCRDGYDLVC